MKISVVIPAFNEEAFLPHLLASLQKQTFPKGDYEVIVVDNNSTDKTAEIAKEYGARVISEKSRGYAYACNAGFATASGEIIARADADYIQPTDWLEKIWHAFEKDNKLVAIGGPLYPLESTWWQNIVYYPAIVIWMYILKLLGDGFLFPNMAVRKELYKKTGGFDTDLQFGEDTKMCLKLTKLGKVVYSPNIYVYTSMRKAYSLGLIQTVFGYSIGNHISMWMGKKATIGLEVVRTVPQAKPKPYQPWIFLYAIPLSAFVLLVGTFFFFSSTTTTNQVLTTTRKMAQMSDEMIRKFTENSRRWKMQ
ncbi:MAG: glycosyltransferase [Candidatus Levybacteria bacterium]|nr:glycosyltransferase [Candidatus Levybacteria bacterium]